MCELNSEVKMFCTTTSSPIQATSPSPRNSSRCASHIAYKQDDPDNTPLHRNVQRLVVWIADDLAAGAGRYARGGPLE